MDSTDDEPSHQPGIVPTVTMTSNIFQQIRQQQAQHAPGLHPQGGPPNTAQQQMPPPPQPQQPGQPNRPAHSESPNLANAQPPTPTPANKTVSKAKAAKDRPKRSRKGTGATPATPGAADPPTPTTPITPHAPPPFGQHANNAPPPPQGPQQPLQQQPQPGQQPGQQQDQQPLQDAGPSAFSSIDHAGDAANDVWSQEDKWITSLQMTPMDFGSNFAGGLGTDFNTSSFNVGADDDIINYGDFLNDGDNNLVMGDMLWEDLAQEG